MTASVVTGVVVSSGAVSVVSSGFCVHPKRTDAARRSEIADIFLIFISDLRLLRRTAAKFYADASAAKFAASFIRLMTAYV